MHVRDVVIRSWGRVTQDFNEASEKGTGIYWNEEVLRLKFFQHLLSENIELTFFSAETPTYIMGKLNYPDLIIHCNVDNMLLRCVFEFKFWGNMNKWKEDWNKILSYKHALSFNYGYFLAIGPSTRPKAFQKGGVKLDAYVAEALIHGKTWRESFGLSPAIKIAEDLLKNTLDMPYHLLDVFDGWGWVTTLPEDYAIIFDVASKEDKLLILLGFPIVESKLEKFKEIQKKLNQVGFNKYAYFDNETLAVKPSITFEGVLIIQELEVNTYPENLEKAKNVFNRLKPILAGLKPQLKIR